MKKTLLSLLAVLAIVPAANAEEKNLYIYPADDQAVAELGYQIRFWNDYHTDDFTYWPNWRIVFSDDDFKTTWGDNIKLEYKLTKEDDESFVQTATVGTSGGYGQTSNFYYKAGKLAGGTYTMDATLSFYDADGNANGKTIVYPAQKFDVTDPSTFPAALIEKYWSFDQLDHSTIMMDIKLQNIEKEWWYYDIEADAGGGKIFTQKVYASWEDTTPFVIVDNSEAGITYWIKAKVYFQDGTEINCTPWNFTVVAKKPAPTATIKYSVKTPSQPDGDATFSYEVVVDNATAEQLEGATYKVWLDAPGNNAKYTSTTSSGTTTLTVDDYRNGLWLKGEVVLSDGTKPVVTPNDLGLQFGYVEVTAPGEISFTLSGAEAWTATTGAVSYAFTSNNDAAIDYYDVTVYSVPDDSSEVAAYAEGDEAGTVVGSVSMSHSASGTITLTGLAEKAKSNLYAVGTAVLKDGTAMDGIRYPEATASEIYLPIDTRNVISGIDTAAAETTVSDVYSIDGRLVKSGATDLSGLEPGLYIMGGKLYRVR